jgi:hypothetical protein
VRGRSRVKPTPGYKGKKPKARSDSAAPLKPVRQIAHERNRVIMTEQHRVAKPSSRVSPPARHHTSTRPEDEEKEKEYKLYSTKGFLGMCTIEKVLTSRIASRGMTRYRVAMDGKVVGTAAKVSSHMKLLHR